MSAEPAPVPAAQYGADYFLGVCGGIEYFRLYGPKVLKPVMARALALAPVRAGQRVVDVGCGRGELVHHLVRAGAEATGTDFSAEALAIARAHTPEARWVLGDAKGLPFEDASVDTVYFLGVIEHLHDWELEKVFADFHRVLKPGGKVVVATCTNSFYYKSWSHGLRTALAQAARRVGLPLRDPQPPRGEEDLRLHINERNPVSLSRFFAGKPWRATVRVEPNVRYLIDELYPRPLPAGFPEEPISGARRWLYLHLFFRAPLSWTLGRWLTAVAVKA